MSTPAKTRDWTSAELEKPVINYRAENGIAVIEMDDPPANAYTYAMMRQLDDAILKARFDDDVHVIVLRGAGRQVLLRRREHRDAQRRSRRASSTSSACTRTRRSCASSTRRSS